MDLINLSEAGHDNFIIYYTGSFDPPHAGQQSVLDAALEKTQASKAIVVIASRENANKPNRSPWEVRKELASIAFGESDQVLVSQLKKDQVKPCLLEKAHVINLMGSDIWENYSKRSEIDFSGVCVALRYGENPADYITHLKDKEVTYITPEVQGCSSSKIREYLKQHPELYEGAILLPGTILDNLHPKVLEYIVKNKLYYQSKKTELKEMPIEQSVA